MQQPSLAFIQPVDSHVTSPTEQRRLSAQSLAILQRLSQGPATARELAAIALNYRARCSDLRHAGFAIQCDYDPLTGASVYRRETESK